MKIKVSEATPVQLGWMVAKCEGREMYIQNREVWFTDSSTHPDGAETAYDDWPLCGPIIEREGINTYQMQDGTWQANLDYGMTDELIYWGPTPLIAAMRCFVVSKLGDEVDVPEELT